MFRFDQVLRKFSSIGPTLVLVACVLLSHVGCKPASPPKKSSLNPLLDLRDASRRGLWEEAWLHADDVLKRFPDDPDAIASVAHVAHKVGQLRRAAELLVEACRQENFDDEKRIQQTCIAMIEVGRFHDAIDLLNEAVEIQPDQIETRRWLYDFLIGTEDRPGALEHGRWLIQQREFDLELLLSLSNTERRTQDVKPLEEMTKRNPEDLRPLLGEARVKFDSSAFEECVEICRRVLSKHPQYDPASRLLGRALASDQRLDEVRPWVEAQPPRMQKYADYWLTIGDWARAQDDYPAAARCYWEATQRDADVMEAWSKLAQTIRQLPGVKSDLAIPIETIDRRAELLSELDQNKNRFERTGRISRAIVSKIVENLQQLGRPWEAEAWAAIAMTLPEDDSVPIARQRNEIVASLTKSTPWQLPISEKDLVPAMSSIPLPAVVGIAAATVPSNRSGQNDGQTATQPTFVLVNEAEARGAAFGGYTADDLDKPGIMLHETLGCGGGTIDFDLDGWPDLYFTAAGGKPPHKDSPPNSLRRNVGGRFIDVTQESSTGDRGFGQSVAVGDVNEDGFPDLLVLNYGPNELLINNGDGTFRNASASLLHEEDASTAIAWSTCAAIADIDGDGIADICVVNYCDGLEPTTDGCPMKNSDIMHSCSPMKFPARVDQFYRGQGDGQFAEATSRWNAKPQLPGRGLGIVAGNFDGVAGNDILVANDMTNNHFWTRNSDESGPRLIETAVLKGLAGDDRMLAQGSMGIAVSDFDRDGDIDFYVTNFDQEYNTLYDQVSGMWRDRTAQSDLVSPTLPLVGFGTQAVDLDGDGSPEIVVTNGHVDLFSRDEKQALYAQPMQIFQRQSSGKYEDLIPSLVAASSASSDYVSTAHVGRSLWTMDANRDQRPDLVITHQTEPAALLINRSVINQAVNERTEDRGQWMEIVLRGTSSSRDAIGSTVIVTIGGQTVVASQVAGGGYMCSSEQILRLQLGDAAGDVSATVIWPNGNSQTFSKLDVNAQWLLLEGQREGFLVLVYRAKNWSW